jgi:hypothetical protein
MVGGDESGGEREEGEAGANHGTLRGGGGNPVTVAEKGGVASG